MYTHCHLWHARMHILDMYELLLKRYMRKGDLYVHAAWCL